MSRLVLRVAPEFADQGYDGRGAEDEERTFVGEPGMDPPKGECYQIWQDVGDQTPISPVFAIRSDCVDWVMRTHQASRAAASKFIDDGRAPSFVGTQFGLFSGVQMAADISDHLDYLAPEGSHRKGIRVRHLASGVEGTVQARMQPPSDEYYLVIWDRALPSLLAEDPTVDPDKPMEAGARSDGFEVIVTPTTAGDTA